MRLRSFASGLAVSVALATLTACGGGGTSVPAEPSSGAAPSPVASSGAAATPVPTATITPGPASSASGSSGSQKAGPAILYMPPATAPQLANTGLWGAPPILISGASAYRMGEFLYQDFLYDDHGASGAPDANQTNESVGNLLAKSVGTYTYPTNPSYGGNAADLVEFRMKLTSNATAFRVTFNTMIDPTLEAFTIALGGGTTAYAMPHGANCKSPAEYFLTVYGSNADLVDAVSGNVVAGAAPQVTVDLAHRQVQVLLPFSAYDPRGNTALRVAIATGLWNVSANTYLLPAATSSAGSPGGAAAVSPAAFFNVGFRYAEPSNGAGDVANSVNSTSWRESLQAAALANGDISQFYGTVDMIKLAAGVSDDMPGQPQGVPQTGHMNRILVSHFEPFQGRDFTGCQGTNTYCSPEYGSALEPYSIYVPKEAAPAGGYQLTLLLHSLSTNYNQYANTNNEREFAERGKPSIVYTTEARGPDNWYYNLAEAEVFEVWSDIAERYPVNTSNVALTGYSMGGYATFKLGTLFPDLFAIMQPTVGPAYVASGNGGPTDTKPMYPSLRNIPILSWHASADELVQTPFAVQEEQQMSSIGLNFEWDLFSPAEHLTLALNDSFQPAADFLGAPTLDPNPAHVTYVRNPSMDNATYGIVADHAYWLSAINERDTSQTTGSIDVFSHGFGVADPPTSGTQPVSTSLPAGNVAGCCTSAGFKNTRGKAPAASVADTLTITAINIGSVTVEPVRAKVDCNAQLQVATDGPLTVTLDGCANGSHTFSANRLRKNVPVVTPPPGARRTR